MHATNLHAALLGQADILVSELLGSFGDNELSPECLDGVQHVLKNDGISIPCASTSYVAPLMSAKLYNEMRAMKSMLFYTGSPKTCRGNLRGSAVATLH
jgi:hypothetical protein